MAVDSIFSMQNLIFCVLTPSVSCEKSINMNNMGFTFSEGPRIKYKCIRMLCLLALLNSTFLANTSPSPKLFFFLTIQLLQNKLFISYIEYEHIPKFANIFPASGKFNCLLTTFANSLDPYL